MHVEANMLTIVGKMTTKGLHFVSGFFSLILLPAGGLGTAIGLGRIVVGFVVFAGSILYEMRCGQEHAKKLMDIFARVEAEVNRFTESQKKVFSELGCL